MRVVIHGKDMLARAGGYTVAELKRGLAVFLEKYRPAALAKAVPLGMPMRKDAAAVATSACPTVPLAPARFSMITGCPMLCDILSDMARAMMSVVLPAAKGTMTRTGLLG